MLPGGFFLQQRCISHTLTWNKKGTQRKKENLKPFDMLRSHVALLITLKVKRAERSYRKSILVLHRNKGTERVTGCWWRTRQASDASKKDTICLSMCTLTIKSPLFSNLNYKIDKNVSLIGVLWHDCSLEIQRFLTDSLFVLHKQDLKAKQACGAKKGTELFFLFVNVAALFALRCFFFLPFPPTPKNQLILFYSSKKTNPEITQGFSAALRKLRQIYKPQGSLTRASLLELCVARLGMIPSYIIPSGCEVWFSSDAVFGRPTLVFGPAQSTFAQHV